MLTVSPLERRLASLLLAGRTFTADDVTDNGTVGFGHAPNAAPNAIGAMFNQASRRGLIDFTGEVVRSNAPHRKGGCIRVWHGTEAGRLWARNVLE